MTASSDGTVRTWDMESLVQKAVIKPQLAKPGRVQVTAAAYGPGGGLIAAGLMDGTIQLWDIRGKPGLAGGHRRSGAPANWGWFAALGCCVAASPGARSRCALVVMRRRSHRPPCPQPHARQARLDGRRPSSRCPSRRRRWSRSRIGGMCRTPTRSCELRTHKV